MAWFFFSTIVILNSLHQYACVEKPKTSTDYLVRSHKQKHFHKAAPSGPSVDETEPASVLATEPNKLWRFELDMPEVLKKIQTYTGLNVTGVAEDSVNEQKGMKKPIARTGPTATTGNILKRKLQFEITPPAMNDVVQSVQSLMTQITRSLNKETRRFDRIKQGYTEEEPGVVKSLIVAYPPRYQEGRLIHLLNLQKKRDKAKAGII